MIFKRSIIVFIRFFSDTSVYSPCYFPSLIQQVKNVFVTSCLLKKIFFRDLPWIYGCHKQGSWNIFFLCTITCQHCSTGYNFASKFVFKIWILTPLARNCSLNESGKFNNSDLKWRWLWEPTSTYREWDDSCIKNFVFHIFPKQGSLIVSCFRKNHSKVLKRFSLFFRGKSEIAILAISHSRKWPKIAHFLSVRIDERDNI